MATETPTTQPTAEHRDARGLVYDMDAHLNRIDALLTGAAEMTSRDRDVPQEVANSVYLLVTDAHSEIEKLGELRDRLTDIVKGGSSGSARAPDPVWEFGKLPQGYTFDDFNLNQCCALYQMLLAANQVFHGTQNMPCMDGRPAFVCEEMTELSYGLQNAIWEHCRAKYADDPKGLAKLALLRASTLDIGDMAVEVIAILRRAHRDAALLDAA